MSLVQKNDILFAYKALIFDGSLSSAGKSVGAALIEHFNKKTGRCDPSIKRLAKLLGVSRATVNRGNAELCDRDQPYFVRVSHGGRNNCTTYSPQWHRFRAFVLALEARFRDGLAPSNASVLRPSRAQNCDIPDLKDETQTRPNNPLKEPLRNSVEEGPQLRPEVRSGDNVVRMPAPHQRSVQGMKVYTPSHAQAAETAAVKRILSDARANDSALYTRISIEADDVMLTQAAQVEMKQAGTGLRALLEILDHAETNKRSDGSI